MSTPLTYLAHENEYRSLVTKFVSGAIAPAVFIEEYCALWNRDRDAQWEHLSHGGPLDPEEKELNNLLDRIFTACDFYSDDPKEPYEISEDDFRMEVAELARLRWPEG